MSQLNSILSAINLIFELIITHRKLRQYRKVERMDKLTIFTSCEFLYTLYKDCYSCAHTVGTILKPPFFFFTYIFHVIMKSSWTSRGCFDLLNWPSELGNLVFVCRFQCYISARKIFAFILFKSLFYLDLCFI